MPRLSRICCAVSFGLLASASPLLANDDPAAIEFFEKKIRPVLVEHCYECHSSSADTIQAGLLLDTAEKTRRGGDSGAAVVPGAPEDSLLLSAIRYESFEMPPDSRLPDDVIQDFETWIASGAADPRTEDSPAKTPATAATAADPQTWWAFQAPQPATIPAKHANRNPIDVLVQARLAEQKMAPNPRADKATLLKRMTFDLIGLPPTAEELADFLADDSDDAVAQAAERLLQSPHYGERWARPWLDLARYAEDQAHIVGNNTSLFYPNAWKYRDWVIQALNSDMPYDDFVRQQLAADLLDEGQNDANLAALGFIGLGPKYYRRGDPEVMADEWEDRVDVVSRGLLGLTVACARCHDHKFDPIPTEDYYALAGIFASTRMFNRPLSDNTTTEAVKADDSSDQKQPAAIQVDNNGEAKEPDQALHVVAEGQIQDLAVMIRGKVDNRGEVVPRGFIQVAFPGPRREFQEGSGRRELAEAIVDPRNPLTARVFVNRIWQQYFGRGIVATASNFGSLGEPPTHPQLLDDLAARFVSNGYSIKWLHRQIVLSETYQQTSDNTAQAFAADPSNQWLWKMPRRRLSVEAWRDAVLAVSGRLNRDIGGPSLDVTDPDETRRTVYATVSRFQLDPLLALFDFPDPNSHAERRVETNTPLQKLFLLNSPFMITQAQHVAQHASSAAAPDADTIPDIEAVVSQLFQTVYLRDPTPAEQQAATQFLQQHPDQGPAQLAQTLLASNEFWFVD